MSKPDIDNRQYVALIKDNKPIAIALRDSVSNSPIEYEIIEEWRYYPHDKPEEARACQLMRVMYSMYKAEYLMSNETMMMEGLEYFTLSFCDQETGDKHNMVVWQPKMVLDKVEISIDNGKFHKLALISVVKDDMVGWAFKIFSEYCNKWSWSRIKNESFSIVFE
jgi:hypothetical protein